MSSRSEEIYNWKLGDRYVHSWTLLETCMSSKLIYFRLKINVTAYILFYTLVIFKLGVQ